MKVLCFGDSNTYGYEPRSFFGGRYEANCRWVDILGAKTGWEIINEGENGREIPLKKISIPEAIDLLIVMLGTNDLLQGNSLDKITERMEGFLDSLPLEKNKILLIAPPPMKLGMWVPAQSFVDASVQLAACYRDLAKRLSIGFTDAGKCVIPMTFDGVHFTEEGHRAFAERLYKYLTNEGKWVFPR